jgi:hypothetical protein
MLAVLAFANVATAEQDGFKISGDFAGSIFSEKGKGGNSGAPSSGAIGNGAGAGGVADGNDTAASIDLAEINIEKAMGNSSIVLGIGYGRIFDTINYTLDVGNLGAGAPAKSTLNLTNAYFQHKLGDTGLSFRFGKFESFMGHENYNYMDNMNYSRGYAFYYTMPFYLTGLNANYVINEMFDIGLYVVNSTANTDIDENRSKALGAALNIKPMEGLAVKLNYLSAEEGNSQSATLPTAAKASTMNAIVSYQWNMMDFAFQYVDKSSDPNAGGDKVKMNVMGLYAGYKADVWGAGLRYEMAKYDAGSTMDNAFSTDLATIPAGAKEDNKISAITASAWYDVDTNARVKLDIASHSSDEEVFVDKDGVADDKMMVYGLGFMYRF